MAREFRYSSSLRSAKFSDELTADVELFREGSWAHDSAPGGWFTVDKNRIQDLINNFNRGICGYELPLEFGHKPDSRQTPGWLKKMYEKKLEDGTSSLWATLQLTDKTVAQRIKDGSLRFISPTVVSDYLDTANGQKFEVIRSATLTNYPHIKRLNPMSVNFEEIRNKEEHMTENEITAKNASQLEDIESLTLEDLGEGEIDLEYLTDEQIQKLAEHFEMTTAQFQEKYPAAGKKIKMYGTRPKIKAPAEVPSDRKKEFFDKFNTMYDKHKDVDKATKATLRWMKLEEDDNDNAAIRFVDHVVALVSKKLGRKPDRDAEDNEEKITLEELQNEIKSLRLFKEKAELEEDYAYIEGFANMTPAVKKIVQTLLTAGRGAVLEFEDKQISLHELIIQLFEEIAKTPSTNMFEVKSITGEDQIVDLSEEAMAGEIQKWLEEHPGKSYREGYDAIWLRHRQPGGR